jgi:hypothetical protein
MSKYLRDISFWFSSEEEKGTQLSYETNFLELLYLDCLPKVETGGIAKVVLHPCRTVVGEPLKLINNPDVIRFSKVFDFTLYGRSDKQTKKLMALEFLQSSLMEVAQIKKWDCQPFLKAYNTVLAKNLINERPWGKPITGPKRVKAQPWCSYDSDKAAIYIAFFSGPNLLGKVWITDVKPGDVWINEAVGKLEWESERDVKLTSRDGLSSWHCSVPA